MSVSWCHDIIRQAKISEKIDVRQKAEHMLLSAMMTVDHAPPHPVKNECHQLQNGASWQLSELLLSKFP